MGRNRVGAAAVIVAATSGRTGASDGGDGLLDGLLHWFGRETWHLDLEVRPPGLAPYRVDVRSKVSNRLGGLRNAFKHWQPVPGLEVPVLVDPSRPADVEVDWRAFAAGGGLNRAAELTAGYRARQSSAAVAQAMRQDPKRQAQMRANALAHGPGMASQVPLGVRPAHEFARWVDELEGGGAISPQEAADLRRTAGLVDGA